jgi:hypothetical protein
MMGANDGAIVQLEGVRHGPALVEGIQDVLPKPSQGPSAKLVVNTRPLSELLRQMTPRESCARDPENPIQNKPMVGPFAPVRSAVREDAMFENVHYSSVIKSRAKLVSIADTNLNHARGAM